MEKYTHPIILSVIPGVATGWASSTERGRIRSGKSFFRRREFEEVGAQYRRFEQWLNNTHSAAEDIHSVWSEHIEIPQDGFQTFLTSWCKSKNVLYKEAAKKDYRGFITGKNNSDKTTVITTLKTLGYTREYEEEADAIALLHYARKAIGVY